MHAGRRIIAGSRAVLNDFTRHECFDLAAALSYYTLLSFAPLILVVVAIASLVFDRSGVEEHIAREVSTLIGDAGSEVLRTVLENAGEEKRGIAVVIGVVTLLLGASSVFVQLQDALDRILEVKNEPGSSIKRALVSRLLSIAMLISAGFLLLVTLVVSTGIAALQAWIHPRFEIPAWIWSGLDVVISLGVVMLLVALIFKILPRVRMRWGDVWFGALVTAILFTVGKKLIGEYLGRAGVGSAYGAAGSVVVLLAWTYYASIIFFLGAILTRRHADRRAKRNIVNP